MGLRGPKKGYQPKHKLTHEENARGGRAYDRGGRVKKAWHVAIHVRWHVDRKLSDPDCPWCWVGKE